MGKRLDWHVWGWQLALGILFMQVKLSICQGDMMFQGHYYRGILGLANDRLPKSRIAVMTLNVQRLG
jgi:hypothetical protein